MEESLSKLKVWFGPGDATYLLLHAVSASRYDGFTVADTLSVMEILAHRRGASVIDILHVIPGIKGTAKANRQSLAHATRQFLKSHPFTGDQRSPLNEKELKKKGY